MRTGHPPSISRLLIALVAAAALLATWTASASADRAFDGRFGITARGSIAAAGNTLLTCPAATAGCTTAQAGSGANTNNDSWAMTNVDVDADAATFNSSSSTLTLPAGASVLWAGLYWGADTAAPGTGTDAPNAATRGTVLLKAPGAASYATLTAAALDGDDQRSTRYQGFADVTAQVAGGGTGSYTVANVQAATGDKAYAGWSLLVAYRDASQGVRRLSLFDGLTSVMSGGISSRDITLDGLQTPASGAVTGRLAMASYEGDLGLATETATLAGTNLANAANPAGNQFNSTISSNGAAVTTKTPNYANQLGFDLDDYAIDGILGNGVTSTTLHLATTQDLFMPGAVAFAIDEVPGTPANTTSPAVTGTTIDRQVVTADEGTWENSGTLTYGYQWRRCDATGATCADIAGATSRTYPLTAADVGARMRVIVSATNALGTSTAPSNPSAVVTALAPFNTAAPTLAGTTREGQALTLARGTWDGTPTLTYAQQWRRCDSAGANCVNIAGATATSYTLTTADVGSTVRAVVTATNAAGATGAATTATSAIVAIAPANTAVPTVTGTRRDGQTLTGTQGTFSGTGNTYAYQWRRCDNAGANCADIAGANALTYDVVSADVGGTLRLAVTATNSGGSVTVVSATGAVVTGVAPANMALPTVSGSTLEGSTLTAANGTWTGTTPMTFTYQWRRCAVGGAGCVNIAGATASTYTLLPTDVGSTFRVVVKATNVTGNTSATSAATATVTASPPVNAIAPSISGTTTDGQTLTLARGTWTGTPVITYAQQWQRCDSAGANCVAIGGATTLTYVLGPSDTGRTIRAVVTGTNTQGSAPATTAATAVVAPIAPTNTAAPAISGVTTDGRTLTATTGTWTGSPTITYAYQWRRCDSAGANCADIASATSSTYVLTSGDVGGTIRVVVTAANGSSVPATSSATATIAAAPAVNTAAPALSGVVRDGQTLTISSDGTWTGTPVIGFTYRWQRCDSVGASCADIAGATGVTYTLTPTDVGGTVRGIVTGTNAGGSAAANTAVTAVVLATAPVNTALPSVSGGAVEGQTVTANAGTWSGTPAITYAYQWQRCDGAGSSCADIAGETAQTHVLATADVAGTVRAVVTATNTGGSASATSPTAAVGPASPANTLAPSISGAPRDGSTLTADRGTWSGSPTITYAYQWERCDATGTSCADIAGATGTTYDATATDVGARLRVRVTATNAGGSVALSSPATAAVTALAPANTVAPSITGTRQDGQTLTAVDGTWTGTPTIAFTHQWRRCDSAGANCTDIAGATGTTYALGNLDAGQTIRVIVTGTNAGGSANATAPATSTIAATPPVNTTPPSVTGTARDGQALTVAGDGTWTGTPVIGFTYRWQRCDGAGSSCADIPAATGVTYILTSADVTGTVRAVVTGTNTAGSGSAPSPVTGVIAPSAPVQTAAPAITGTARDGSTLTADPGTWSGTPTITYAYQWQRCDSAGSSCTDVVGAVGTTYALSPADVGATIRVAVTAANAAGPTTAYAPVRGPVAALSPANTVAPVLTGTAADGSTLSTGDGSWSGTPTITYARQWQRCDADGTNCTPVAGATGASYGLTPADVGHAVRSVVTATNAGGSASASSTPTAAVAPVAPVNTIAPVASGTLRDGQTLSVTAGTWTGTPAIAYGYRWQRCDSDGTNCTDIAGATGSSYTLTSSDVSHALRAAVTATNAAGSANANAAPTTAVAPAGPAPISAPVLTGSAADGATLNTDAGVWSGTPTITYARQWQRCDADGTNCTAIAGATGTSYTLTPTDVGHAVRSAVTATNAGGTATAYSSPSVAVAAVAPVNTLAPATSGTVRDGSMLNATDGAWTGTPTISFTRQWQRCDADGTNCAPISGATGATYALTSSDVDHAVRVVVSAVNTAGGASAPSAPSAKVDPAPPVNTVAPSTSGTTRDGSVLTAADGTWTGTPTITYTRQWQRCDADGSNCAPISGATSTTYTQTSGDVGHAIRLAVSATNAAGTTTATSPATSAVAPLAPANTIVPTVGGTPRDGSVLTAADGTWTGTPTISYTRQWQRCDSDGSNCAPISGATGTTYTLTSTDVGHALRIVVTATNAAGSAPAPSAPTAAVAPVAPANVSAPAIGGTLADGQILTAADGTWTGTPTITYTRQWQRCDADGSNCAPISGATSTTYVLTSGDVGHAIRLAVTATNAAGSAPASTTTATAVGPTPPLNTVAPGVTGTPADGQTLSVGTGTWTGTPVITYARQWQRCDADGTNCTAIAGATGATYGLSPSDVGHALRALVTATNAAGSATASAAPSASVAPIAPVNTLAPAAAGTPTDGQTLTAADGTWTGTPVIAYARQWQRCDADGTNCTAIAGATGLTYTLTSTDVGHALRVVVKATNAAGNASAPSPATSTVAPVAPANVTAPSVGGTLAEGQTLSADEGTWTGTPTIAYAYRWLRCDSDGNGCAAITGATATTYVLQPADHLHALRAEVTATNAAGSAVATSDPTGAVGAAPPVNTVAPTVSGTRRDGSTLTADDGAWTGTPTIRLARRWQRCDADGSNCTDITGATATTYDLTSADVGHAIRLAVDATNPGGSGSATGAPTAAIAPAPPVNATLPTAAGAATDGATLTAADGTWTGTPTITYSRRWQRCDADGSNCTDITGATATTYDATPADVGHALRVAVTATNAAGTASAASAPTTAVTAAGPANTASPTTTGTTVDGSTLTAHDGTWTGTPTISYAHQWQRCDADGANCTDITGATASTYDLTPADAGHALRLEVTATNSGGTAATTSAPTAPVTAAAPVSTSAPVLSGTPRDGQTLSSTSGAWSGTPAITFTRQWQRCDADGTNCTDIAGATGTTYDATAADAGHALRAVVTAANAAGTASRASAPTTVVAALNPAAGTPPAVAGTERDGSVLTAGDGTWTGTAPLTFTYQWQRCDADGTNCTDIAGATAKTRTLSSADVGHELRAIVTAHNAAGTDSAASPVTGAIAALAPSVTTAPATSGTAREGATLTAGSGSFAGTAPLTRTYQWQRCDSDGSNCTDITGATGSTYTLAAADIGHAVRAIVTAQNAAGQVAAPTAATAVVDPAAPSTTGTPAVTGTARDGQTLTADDGTWTGAGTVTYTHQWQRCDSSGANCTDIAGATDPIYTLAAADADHTVRVLVTATNAGGSTTRAATPTAPVAANPPVNTTRPAATGTGTVGATLTSDLGTWTGTGPFTRTVKWQRCDSDGTNCADIAGATSTSYAMTSDDAGRAIRPVVTASNSAGSDTAAGAPVTVAAASVPPAATPPATTPPTTPTTTTAATTTPPMATTTAQSSEEDLGGLTGSLVAPAQCQTVTVAPSYRRVNVTGIGSVRLRVRSLGVVLPDAPIVVTLDTPTGKMRSAKLTLDGRALGARPASGAMAGGKLAADSRLGLSILPATLVRASKHLLKVVVTPKTGKPRIVTASLKSASCRTRFTAGRWTTKTGAGLRLRVDSRSPLTGVTYALPAAYAQALGKVKGSLGRLRVVAKTGSKVTPLAGTGRPGAAATKAGGPTVKITPKGVVVTGLPTGAGIVEVTLYAPLPGAKTTGPKLKASLTGRGIAAKPLTAPLTKLAAG